MSAPKAGAAADAATVDSARPSSVLKTGLHNPRRNRIMLIPRNGLLSADSDKLERNHRGEFIVSVLKLFVDSYLLFVREAAQFVPRLHQGDGVQSTKVIF